MGERCIEVDFDGVPTSDDADVERRANAAIRETCARSALSHRACRNGLSQQEGPRRSIRVVRIDGVDSCACCGTHVSSTGEVGLIKILRMTTKKKQTRLELLCGRRALVACEEAMDALRETSNFLTVADEEVPEAVRRLSGEKDDLKHQLKQASRKQIDQYVAGLVPDGTLAMCCLPGLDVEDLRYLCERVLEVTGATVCAALSPVDGDATRLAYVIASSERYPRPDHRARSSTPGLEVGAAGSLRWSRKLGGSKRRCRGGRSRGAWIGTAACLARGAIASLRTPVMQRSTVLAVMHQEHAALAESLDAARPTGWCFPQAQGLNQRDSQARPYHCKDSCGV